MVTTDGRIATREIAMWLGVLCCSTALFLHIHGIWCGQSNMRRHGSAGRHPWHPGVPGLTDWSKGVYILYEHGFSDRACTIRFEKLERYQNKQMYPAKIGNNHFETITLEVAST